MLHKTRKNSQGNLMFTSRRCPRHTKRTLVIPLAFSLLFVLLSVTSLVVVQGVSEDSYYSIKSTVTYINPSSGTTTWNFSEEDRTVGLFMNNSWQSVELKDATYSVEALKNDTDGNSIAVLEFPRQQLLPGENVSYTAEYWVVSKPRTIPDILEEQSGTLEDIPPDLAESYTHAEGPWLTRDPTLVELAHEIAGNETKVLNIVKGFVGWIKKNVNYTTHEFPLYPNETMRAGEGDCDDQAILLITMTRIMGIPSYLQIGSIYMPGNGLVNETYWDNHVRVIQRKIGWHGWAMEYVPPWGWLPVDLTYVTAGFADPLNAIRYGAVTEQNTIQYMNFSRADYVAESRRVKTFILENGFFINSEDEMTVEATPNDLAVGIDPSVVLAFGVATTVLLASSLLIARRWRRRLEQPEPTA